MAAPAESTDRSLCVFDFRYAAERLIAILAALDEASEQTSDLHRQLVAEGVYAFTSELLHHAIKMARQLTADLRQLEGLR